MADEPSPSAKPAYEATYRSLEAHPVPAWFEDAKLGIFIHWGLYSVPAWATPSAALGKLEPTEWFRRNPYAEWYLNTLRIPGSPTQEHHAATYGEDFDYYDFAKPFNAAVESWDPNAMAQLFAEVHARYVVLTTKHHDGFTLWPSAVPNPHLPAGQAQATRDLVAELTTAVRARGLRMALYYSGGIDWSFHPIVIDGTAGQQVTPPGPEYAAYADAHWRELIERYQPCILWNDIRYPGGSEILQIIADYYNAHPDGLVNNRWGSSVLVPHDFTTPEYRQYDRITPEKWESCRGLGLSFGYNQVEGPRDMLSVEELVHSFIDIVSKNGNLLLNVGPKPDGSIPALQAERLRGLGRWLDTHGEAIFGTRPWVVAEGGLRGEATPTVRFTFKDDTVFAFLLQRPEQRGLTLENVIAAPGSTIRLLGHEEPLSWERSGDGLAVELPEDLPESVALTLSISPEPACLMRKGSVDQPVAEKP